MSVFRRDEAASERRRLARALAENARYDQERYAAHSFVLGGVTKEHRRAIIRIFSHYLEGGMCFADVRLGYGQEKANSVLTKLASYIDDFGVDDTVLWATDTLRSYLAFHDARGMPLSDIAARLETLTARDDWPAQTPDGGAEPVTAAQIKDAVAFDFQRFLQSRHSVRQYADTPLDDATIRRVAANARECPSVCNRQTCRLYAFNDYAAVQELLTYQAGNAGFRPEIRTLFIVTADMAQMNLVGERFQGWIDGGVFAMTLALSIHAEGLGACFLNWSVEKEQDAALRRRVGIPDNELVITMMAAGHLKPDFAVPVSKRKPVDEILSLNRPLSDR